MTAVKTLKLERGMAHIVSLNGTQIFQLKKVFETNQEGMPQLALLTVTDRSATKDASGREIIRSLQTISIQPLTLHNGVTPLTGLKPGAEVPAVKITGVSNPLWLINGPEGVANPSREQVIESRSDAMMDTMHQFNATIIGHVNEMPSVDAPSKAELKILKDALQENKKDKAGEGWVSPGWIAAVEGLLDSQIAMGGRKSLHLRSTNPAVAKK